MGKRIILPLCLVVEILFCGGGDCVMPPSASRPSSRLTLADYEQQQQQQQRRHQLIQHGIVPGLQVESSYNRNANASVSIAAARGMIADRGLVGLRGGRGTTSVPTTHRRHSHRTTVRPTAGQSRTRQGQPPKVKVTSSGLGSSERAESRCCRAGRKWAKLSHGVGLSCDLMASNILQSISGRHFTTTIPITTSGVTMSARDRKVSLVDRQLQRCLGSRQPRPRDETRTCCEKQIALRRRRVTGSDGRRRSCAEDSPTRATVNSTDKVLMRLPCKQRSRN